ncbi:MAG: SRPBCC family protein [Planctomycetota bacterium]|jgi:uncharacterized protein YndB with AHSA1/START domain
MTAIRQPETYELELTHTFSAPRDEVFQAWTQAEQLIQWFGSHGSKVMDAKVDLRVGGQYHINIRLVEGQKVLVHGTFRQVRVPERLVYTWSVDAPDVGDVRESLVTVEFRERGQRTDLSLRHEALPDEAARERHQQGWKGCFESLAAHVEKG